MDKDDRILITLLLVATHTFVGITANTWGVHEAVQLVDELMVCEPREAQRHGHQ